MPVTSRARVDLPEPLGPTTAMTSPAAICRLMPRRIGRAEPAGTKMRFSIASAPLGAGSAVKRAGAAPPSSASSRRQAARASTSDFHCPISASTGASARPRMIVAAIITPGVAFCSMTSQAATPIIATCTDWRKPRVAEPMPPATRCVASWRPCSSRLAARQRAPSAGAMPMARITSAWRSTPSMKRPVSRDCCWPRSTPARVARSLTQASATSSTALASASAPSSALKAKMTPT